MSIRSSANILSSPIEYLKGVGPQRAELLQKELGIFSFRDLLELYPYRHVDRTVVHSIREIGLQTDFIQVAGRLISLEQVGEKRARRLIGMIRDASGLLELVWFQGIPYIQKALQVGQPYLVYGRVGFFQGSPQMTHPEIELLTTLKSDGKPHLEPVYPSTEKLRARGLGGRQIGKLTQVLFGLLKERDLPEILPAFVLEELAKAPGISGNGGAGGHSSGTKPGSPGVGGAETAAGAGMGTAAAAGTGVWEGSEGGQGLGSHEEAGMAAGMKEGGAGGVLSRWQAFYSIHFPAGPGDFERAVNRLKFEELFLAQIRLGLIRSQRHRSSQGVVFGQVGSLFNDFYTAHLPFELTGAQKRVLREIRKDTGSGRQMNRLLQGDVGSGKTIVALLSMLLAADNGFQSVLMAPTEILAKQHYNNISELLKGLPLQVRLLTGSSRSRQRKEALEMARSGELRILIGTHAVLEDPVEFQHLGLAIVDEQHRFGVAQRARLWKKATVPPHMLVMTATPIPRTLAMTAYGDLDYSIMDELPPGRQPIQTVHRYEDSRPHVMDFIRHEIAGGRQVYIIFPLIEESEKLDYENLMKGYENVKAWFPEPRYWISMVHGRQTNEIKETNMQRFVQKDTQIMVSTTVIEVGVNVPNATVMVIESAEKFGLAQLHQLRGRVGRGSEKSYCILLTGPKLSNDARERIKILCETNNGFIIAEKDLAIRGPGQIDGTAQSGDLNFKLANIVQDRSWLELAGSLTGQILDKDPDLGKPENQTLLAYLQAQRGKTLWSKIS